MCISLFWVSQLLLLFWHFVSNQNYSTLGILIILAMHCAFLWWSLHCFPLLPENLPIKLELSKYPPINPLQAKKKFRFVWKSTHFIHFKVWRKVCSLFWPTSKLNTLRRSLCWISSTGLQQFSIYFSNSFWGCGFKSHKTWFVEGHVLSSSRSTALTLWVYYHVMSTSKTKLTTENNNNHRKKDIVKDTLPLRFFLTL